MAEAKTNGDDSKAVAKTQDDLPLSIALTTARRVLWKGHPPKILSWFLDPLRIYVIDPILSIEMSHIFSFWVDMYIPLLKIMYIQKPEDPNDLGVRTRGALVGPSVVAVRPPSDFQSAFQGGISFVCSAIGDVAGMFTNPKKVSNVRSY
ncbi:MAG: hypothetical protein SGARI_004484 [Bacillariaceae sp.]